MYINIESIEVQATDSTGVEVIGSHSNTTGEYNLLN